MVTKSAAWYDAIYAWKDYPRETEGLHNCIGRHAGRHTATLLDAPCETGCALPAPAAASPGGRLHPEQESRGVCVVGEQRELVTFGKILAAL